MLSIHPNNIYKSTEHLNKVEYSGKSDNYTIDKLVKHL